MDDLFNNEHCELNDLANKSQFIGIYRADKLEKKLSSQNKLYMKMWISDESGSLLVYMFSPETRCDDLTIGGLIYLKCERREHSQQHYWHTLKIESVSMKKALEIFGGNCVAHKVEWKDAFSQVARINNRMLRPIRDVLKQNAPIPAKAATQPMSIGECHLELMLNWLAQIDFNRTYSGTIVILGWLYWLIRSAKDDEQAKNDIYTSLTPLRTNAQVDSPWLWAAIDTIVATPIDGCIFEAYSEQRDLILVDLVFNYTKRATDLVFSRTGLCKNYDDF
jgi:hypothetical protein